MHGYGMLQISMLLLLVRRGGANNIKKDYLFNTLRQYTASLIAGHDND